jgi:hypothetical protein
MNEAKVKRYHSEIGLRMETSNVNHHVAMDSFTIPIVTSTAENFNHAPESLYIGGLSMAARTLALAYRMQNRSQNMASANETSKQSIL